MALSKPLKASLINVEGGRASSANAPLAGAGATSNAQAGSLIKLFIDSGVNQDASYAYSDFDGKSFSSLKPFSVGAGIVENGNTACATLSSSFTYYHDGIGTYPAVDDIVYQADQSTVATGGTGTNYAIFAGLGSPIRFFRITGSTGTVQGTGICP